MRHSIRKPQSTQQRRQGRQLGLSLAFATTTLLAPVAPAGADQFDQGNVTIRPFRNVELARQHAAASLETENLYGLTLGSDTDHAGARGIAVETLVGVGRGPGQYLALGSKLEFSRALTDTFAVSLSAQAGLRAIKGVAGLEDESRLRADGIGGEFRWRLRDRATDGVGITLHSEPSIRFADETSGKRGIGYGAENRLIIDATLLPGQLYGAVNLIYDIEMFRERGSTTWERGSTGGVSAAFSANITPGLFLGADLRYLRAHEGLFLQSLAGQAIFAGPTLFWRGTGGFWLSGTVSTQLWGRARGSTAGLDHTNFTRMLARLKIGMEF